MSYGEYVPVAERRARAAYAISQMRANGPPVKPVEINGRTISHTFWGKAWCENLESFSDFASRLPRGRTYARNGSVMDLQISEGLITALVAGSTLYTVNLRVSPLPEPIWDSVLDQCAGQISSVVELLAGKLSKGVMDVVARPREGLFPTPTEIRLSCDCPDWASMCKHVAAALYGVGARLDHEPETLFLLRGRDASVLVEAAIARGAQLQTNSRGKVLKTDDLASIFGVDIDFDFEIPTRPRGV
jgi:uncharacterized Zn finger protein